MISTSRSRRAGSSTFVARCAVTTTPRRWRRRDAVGPEAAQRVGDRVADRADAGADGIPSSARNWAASGVGARCSDVIAATARRLTSSRERSLNERSPASRCTTGTWWRRAASPNSGTVLVSPSSTTASGRRDADGLVRVLEDRADVGGLAVGERPAFVGGEVEVGEELVGEPRVVVLAGRDACGRRGRRGGARRRPGRASRSRGGCRTGRGAASVTTRRSR